MLHVAFTSWWRRALFGIQKATRSVPGRVAVHATSSAFETDESARTTNPICRRVRSYYYFVILFCENLLLIISFEACCAFMARDFTGGSRYRRAALGGRNDEEENIAIAARLTT